MRSCVRMLVRRICLRKGLFSVVLTLYVVGFLGVFYFLNHPEEEELQGDHNELRSVKVVRLWPIRG